MKEETKDTINPEWVKVWAEIVEECRAIIEAEKEL